MARRDVLELLYRSEDEFLSGEWMSEQLGVSRAAISKQIAALREEGYIIESVPRKGHLLKKSPYGVEEVKLRQLLGSCTLGRDLICVPTIGSTNTEVKQRSLSGAREGLVVIAQEQTAGRGRRGRDFYSPPEMGVYLSVLLRPSLTYGEVADLTAWVAVAMWRGIYDFCGVAVGIKWTNDLVWEGKKFCGILTELILESGTEFVESVVVGVGTNLSQKESDFPDSLGEIATSLGLVLGDTVDHTKFCASVISSLNQMYLDFPKNKSYYLETYRKHCITIGKEVLVVKGEQSRPARALDVDEDFHLLVEYEDGSGESLSSGEVSIRGRNGYIS